jgi:hypothetical protein
MKEPKSLFWLLVKYLLRQEKHWLIGWQSWHSSPCGSQVHLLAELKGRFVSNWWKIQFAGSRKLRSCRRKTEVLITSPEINITILSFSFSTVLNLGFEIGFA